LKGKRRKPVPKLCHTSLATCGEGAVALRGSASALCLGPKDIELSLNRAKPEETQVEARSGTNVQIVRLI